MKTSSLALSIALFALLGLALANPDCISTKRNLCHNTFEACIRTCDSDFESNRTKCETTFDTCRGNCVSTQTYCKNNCTCNSNCTSYCQTRCGTNSNSNCVNRCRDEKVNDCKASCDNPKVTCQNSCQNDHRNCTNTQDYKHVSCKNTCNSNQNTCFDNAVKNCTNPPAPSPSPSPPSNNSTVPPPSNDIKLILQSPTEVLLQWNNKELRVQQFSDQGLLEVYLRETVGNTKNNYKLKILSFNSKNNNGQPGNPINVGSWTPFVINGKQFSAHDNILTVLGTVGSSVSTLLSGTFGNNTVFFTVQLTAFKQVNNGPNFNFDPILSPDQILRAFGTGILGSVKYTPATTTSPITYNQVGSNTNNGQTQYTLLFTLTYGNFSELKLTA